MNKEDNSGVFYAPAYTGAYITIRRCVKNKEDNSCIFDFPLTKFHIVNRVRAITPKPYGIYSYNFTSACSVLPRKFITGDNVPGLLKKWGHLRKKWGHCEENDGPVIWRSKISLPSVYIITDHTLTVINNLLTN